MRLKINLKLRKALLACFAIVAASCFTINAYAAENDDFDNDTFAAGTTFTDESYLNSTWVNATLAEVVFFSMDYEINLKQSNFTGANLNSVQMVNVDASGSNFTDTDFTSAKLAYVDFRGANFTNAIFRVASSTIMSCDFRGANMATAVGLDFSDTHNSIDEDGIINISGGASILIKEIYYASPDAEGLNVKLNKSAYLGNVPLLIEQGGQFEITGVGTTLTLSSSHRTTIEVAAAAPTSLLLSNGASLVINSGTLIDIQDNSAAQVVSADFTFLDAAAGTTVDKTALEQALRFNGATLAMAELSLVQTGTSYKITGTVNYNYDGMNLSETKLNGAYFGAHTSWRETNLSEADLDESIFDGVALQDTNFEDTSLESAQFKNITSAEGANFSDATFFNALIDSSNFDGVDFTDAQFSQATILSSSTFRGANFTNANLFTADFSGSDITGAIITAATFGENLGASLTHEMLLSTQNGRNKDYTDVDFWGSDLEAYDFSGTKLVNVEFENANLKNAQFEGADITGAEFNNVINSDNMTLAMLASTANAQAKNLSAIAFIEADLSGYDFTGYQLVGTHFSEVDLTDATFTDAHIQGADFYACTNLSHEQLESTASYEDRDFSGLSLSNYDFSGFDFSGMSLTQSTLYGGDFAGADFSNADLRLANINNAQSFDFSAHKNLINTNGDVLNVELNSADDLLTVRGAVEEGESGEVYVTLKQATSISAGATVDILSGGALKLQAAALTLTSTGNLLINAPHNGDSALMLTEGSSLTLESGAFIDITLADAFFAPGYTFDLLSVDSSSTLLDLDELAAALRINGKTITDARFELSLFNGTYKLTSYLKASDGDCIWLGDTSNIWSRATTNWKDGAFPSELASVYLTNEGSGLVVLDGAQTVNAIYVQDINYSLSGSELNVGTLKVNEGLTLTLANSEVNISTQINAVGATIAYEGTLNLEGGQAHQVATLTGSDSAKIYLKAGAQLLAHEMSGGALLHIDEKSQLTVDGFISISSGSVVNNGTLTIKESAEAISSMIAELKGSGKLILEDDAGLNLNALELDSVQLGQDSRISLQSLAEQTTLNNFESKGLLTSDTSHLVFNAAVAVGGDVIAPALSITAPSHFGSIATDTLHINTTLSADAVALNVVNLLGKTDRQSLQLGLSGVDEHMADGNYLILSSATSLDITLSYTAELQAQLDAILADDRAYGFVWSDRNRSLSLTISSGDLTTWNTSENFAAKYNSETGFIYESTKVELISNAGTGQITSFDAFEKVKAINVNDLSFINLELSGQGVLALNNLSGEATGALIVQNGEASLNNNSATTHEGELQAVGMELSVNNSASSSLSLGKLVLTSSNLHITEDSVLSVNYLEGNAQGAIKNEGSLSINNSAVITALTENSGALTLRDDVVMNIEGAYANTGLVTIGSNAELIIGSELADFQIIELGDVNSSGTIDGGIHTLSISSHLTKSGHIEAGQFIISSSNSFESLEVGFQLNIVPDAIVDIALLSTDYESDILLFNDGKLSLSEVSGAFSIIASGQTTIKANSELSLHSISSQDLVVEAGANLTLSDMSTLNSLSGEGTLVSKTNLVLVNGGSSIGHLQVDNLSLIALSSSNTFLTLGSISSYTEAQSITLRLSSTFNSLAEGSYSIFAGADLSWDMFEWSSFSQNQFDTLVANGRLYEFVESETGLTIEITLAAGVNNLWYTSNSFAAKYNSEGELYPSTEIPLLDENGNITSYEAFDAVDNIYVDASVTLDLSTIDTGVAATDELTLRHLSGSDAEATLTLLGEGKELDGVTLYNNYNSTMQGKVDAEGISLVVDNAEHIVLSMGGLELTDSRLTVMADSQLALGTLYGDGSSVIGGELSIYGEGGSYLGSYEDAHVSIEGESTNQTLLAGAGLHLSGSEGTVTLVVHRRARVVHSLGSIANTGTSLDLLSLKGDTLHLNEASSMAGGTLTLSINAPVSNMSTVFAGEALTLSELNVAVYASDQSVIDEIEAQGAGSYTLFDFGDNTTLGDGVEINFMGELAKYVQSWTLNTDDHSIDVIIRTDFYADLSYSGNGAAGGKLIIDMDENHKPSGELEDAMHAVLELIDVQDDAGANSLAAAIAGASVTSLGSAQISTIESRLQGLRTQDNSQLKKGEGHAWIAAEGGFNELSQDASMAGHSLNTWGGSVGGAWGVSENCQVSASFSALYGDLDAKSVDTATGDMDSYYLAVGMQLAQGKWQHRFVATMGFSDASLERTVAYDGGAYRTEGDTSGFALGLMYELGYEIALDEQKESVLEPLINLSFVSSSLDGYTEQGGSAALKVGEQENSYLSVGLGARYKQQVNAVFSYSAHALVRFDAGDRQSEAEVSFADVNGARATVQGAEPGAVGIELGAGANYTLDEQSALFINAGIDLRGEYSNVNASVGYRLSF